MNNQFMCSVAAFLNGMALQNFKPDSLMNLRLRREFLKNEDSTISFDPKIQESMAQLFRKVCTENRVFYCSKFESKGKTSRELATEIAETIDRDEVQFRTISWIILRKTIVLYFYDAPILLHHIGNLMVELLKKKESRR